MGRGLSNAPLGRRRDPDRDPDDDRHRYADIYGPNDAAATSRLAPSPDELLVAGLLRRAARDHDPPE